MNRRTTSSRSRWTDRAVCGSVPFSRRQVSQSRISASGYAGRPAVRSACSTVGYGSSRSNASPSIRRAA